MLAYKNKIKNNLGYQEREKRGQLLEIKINWDDTIINIKNPVFRPLQYTNNLKE